MERRKRLERETLRRGWKGQHGDTVVPERHRPSTRPTGSQNSFGARPLWTVAKAKLARVQQLQLIAEFVGEKWEEMRTVFYRSMRAIEQG